jgi:hypothetical protein
MSAEFWLMETGRFWAVIHVDLEPSQTPEFWADSIGFWPPGRGKLLGRFLIASWELAYLKQVQLTTALPEIWLFYYWDKSLNVLEWPGLEPDRTSLERPEKSCAATDRA